MTARRNANFFSNFIQAVYSQTPL